MQGQRGTIGSLPEMLDFDHGSTSSDAIDQQICWNSTRNPAENRMPDYVQSPGDMNVGFVNSMGHERQHLSRWCLGEPSSSNSQSEVSRDERKPELGWSSSVDPSAEAASGFVGHGGDNNQVMECPNTYKRQPSISAPSEQGNPRLGAGGRELTSDSLPDSNAGRSSEGSHRNFRVRINPSNQQSSIPSARFSTGRAVRHSGVSSSQHSPSLLPVDHNMDLGPAPALDNMSSQNQPVVIHVPALPQNVQSLRWSGGGSSSRTGSLSNSVVFGDRDAPPREEVNSRSMARHILDHPIFVPATELRNSARHPAASAPTWIPHHNSHPQFPRRLSEYVRRSLFSATGNESGSQGTNYLPLRSAPASSAEIGNSSGAGNQGHHHSHPRSNRLVSEQICNVLGLMRRGESLRFEDVMILDQSVLFGVADIHDRHRDMRLDVDNMSYEELLALEERIGNVSTGLSEETISNRLKHKKYIAVGSQAETEPCCVCQEEYNDGEDLGMLECGHDFHSDCIKQWLKHKNLCPICKTTALAT
ncbi:putative E3 ubiquitin-protein ligase RHG1A [Prunus yedoensis var. nudiflora]|uniref:RING-type E3 ubiquitin transferase n=1 Tax=Prunus yedoensis var. nudiflora TaxID=2094558 RepID=A0A314Z8E4_PRUYE|nr:putative E3 ubiquitin-protein ligase RHG1A [Prunus yedoensis var. nudiflora]